VARTVTAKELKNRLGVVLEAVAQGERVVVTRHGKPFAVVAPFEAEADVPPYEEAWADIEATLAGSEPEHPTWQEAMSRSRGRP
jgi:prevent-host-death family protein